MKPPKRLFKREQPDPGPSGPGRLMQWTLNCADHWAAACRGALKLGATAAIGLAATPHDDRIDTPPEGFMPMTRAEASRMLPSLAPSLLTPASPGTLFCVASKRFGRLGGSFL